MRWITLEDCQQIYVSQINAGTLLRPEILDAAIHAPLQSFGGVEAYPTLIEKVARLTFGIAQAQAYLDGNKRLAWHCAVLVLQSNSVSLD